MSDHAVRPATLADLGRLWLFDALSSDDGEARYEKNVWAHALANGQVLVAITPQNRPSGFLLFERRGQSFHIHDVFVAQRYRGEGIGHDFMEALCDKADAEKKSLHLEVAKVNKGAISLYRHFDFAVTGALASTHLVMQRSARTPEPSSRYQ